MAARGSLWFSMRGIIKGGVWRWGCGGRLVSVLVVLGVFLQGFPPGAHADDKELQYHILEELPPNTYISDIVEDAKLDMGERRLEELQQLQFSLLDRRGSHQSFKDFFTIHTSTGILRTAKVIDRDQICPHETSCSIHLNVMVQPGQFFQIIKITISITDLNDNGPVFPQSVIIKQVPEASSPGTAFSLPSAEDLDSGVFGVQQYQLVTNTPKFELRVTNSSTIGVVDLHLILKERLDREEIEVYNMEVVALDGGTPPKSGSMRVQVQVQDANDNNPKFNNYTYTVSIVENIPVDSTVIRLHAHDPDAGLNGDVVYEFSPQTQEEYGDLFAIDADTGEIYVRGTVDYEQGSVYYLTVTAHDRGPNSLPAYAKVVVHVIDINDHSPEITLNALTTSGLVEVSEGAAVGTFVAHVSVVDLDGGASGEVTCNMDSRNFELQQLYQTEYKITTKSLFDREKQSEYHLNMVCQDSGIPHQSSTKHIQVRVVDSNDNGPVFWRQGYIAELRENNPMNAYVTQVNATDRDAGRNSVIRYSITDGNSRGLLAISPNTGVIRATVVFDYERQRQYRFILMAKDQGSPPKSSTATLTLNILDTNDEAPMFAQNTYTYGVYENRPPGTEVGYVRASDPDSNPYNEILYSLDLWKGGFDEFSIDSITGQLTTKRELDREVQDAYHLVVVARNRGYPHMKTTVNVTVFVADQNDNAPIIDYPHQYNNTIFISNRLPLGSRVVQIKAHDPDYGDSGALTYTIVSGNDKDVFILNTTNGWVTVKRPLEEYHSQIHRFVIMVSDHGEPQHSSRTELHIVVNKSVAVPQSRNSGFSLFNIKDSHLIIGTAVIVFLIVVLVVAIVAVQCRQRRSNRGSKYNCRREARKRNGADTPSANGGWTKADLKDKPKKAVTFRMDMDDSDADDGDSLWPPNGESEPPPVSPT